MRYLRDSKHIAIKGSVQKRKLRNIGYFHGYKGYRFITTSSKQISYSNFDELMAIYDFDMKLKTLFFPQVMFLETALKNRVLELVLEETQSSSFNTIFAKALDDYKSYSPTGKTFRSITEEDGANSRFKKQIYKRLRLRDEVYSALSRDYNRDRNTVKHFYEQDMNVPIWAIFESITLGTFAQFVSCLNSDIRKKLSTSLKIRVPDDANNRLIENVVYTIKDLRNSIAHNDIIFDVRFKTSQTRRQVDAFVKNTTGIDSVNFSSIDDYLILICCMLKQLDVNKTEILSFITDFSQAIERLRSKIPVNIYNKIIPTSTPRKLIALKDYIRK